MDRWMGECCTAVDSLGVTDPPLEDPWKTVFKIVSPSLRSCHSDWLLTVLTLWLTGQNTGDSITRKGSTHLNTSVFDWCCFCYVEKLEWISASTAGWSHSHACDQNDINSLHSWELWELDENYICLCLWWSWWESLHINILWHSWY